MKPGLLVGDTAVRGSRRELTAFRHRAGAHADGMAVDLFNQANPV
jgi:hypothetical protein